MRRQEIPALTSLRFPAAFAILLFHYLAEMTSLPVWLFQNLSMGVSFFYVLSGFILNYNYPSLTDPKAFWMARFARIWPVHFATLILVLTAVPFPYILGHASWPFTLPLNLLLLQAWVPWKGSVLSFNGVAWSLSVEAYFYLMFPLLLLLFRRWGAVALLTASFLQGLILVLLGQFVFHWDVIGMAFPAYRLFEFVLGMYACRLWQARTQDFGLKRFHEIASLLACVILVMGVGTLLVSFAASFVVLQWFVTETSALCFAWLIWSFAYQSGPISRLLSARIAVSLGQVSFSLYMVHQIVLQFLRVHGYLMDLPPMVFFGVYLALSLAGAYFLFLFVEEPARRWILNAYRRAGSRLPPQAAKSQDGVT